MLDIKALRENPQTFDLGWQRRGLEPQTAGLLALDEKRRALQTEIQALLARRNEASRQIGVLKKNGENADAVMAEVADLKVRLPVLEEEERTVAAELESLLASLPNIPADETPTGVDETENVVVRSWGAPREFDFTPREHFDLGENLGQMHFDRAAKLSGSRFVVLSGGLARLERALGAFMIDLHSTEHGYREVATPVLVRDDAMFGTGQLPKFSEDFFRTTNGFSLIPTAEVTLTNLHMGEIIDEEKLPIRYAALTPCFRSEAGSAGKDTRGMIRQHQFMKVEIVSLTTPEQAAAEHERLTNCAEEVLKRLELPYRTLELCTGDIGFSSRRTFDLEVWLPGQGLYREISSCSHFGDFQARRMKTRFRPTGAKDTRFIHTLNGSGLAVGRTLVAVLENYQQADGTIRVPTALRPYMNGLEVISKDG